MLSGYVMYTKLGTVEKDDMIERRFDEVIYIENREY
jgi:hypothetical protein